MDDAVLHMEVTRPVSGMPTPKPAVLHGAGDARLGIGVIIGPHGVKGLHQGGARVGNLPVRESLAGADGVAVADFKGGDAHHFGQLVQVALAGEAALGHAEAPESARRAGCWCNRPCRRS